MPPMNRSATAVGMSLVETLIVVFAVLLDAMCSSSAAVRPTFIFPSRIAIVAGMAPSSLMMSSRRWAVLQ